MRAIRLKYRHRACRQVVRARALCCEYLLVQTHSLFGIALSVIGGKRNVGCRCCQIDSTNSARKIPVATFLSSAECVVAGVGLREQTVTGNSACGCLSHISSGAIRSSIT